MATVRILFKLLLGSHWLEGMEYEGVNRKLSKMNPQILGGTDWWQLRLHSGLIEGWVKSITWIQYMKDEGNTVFIPRIPFILTVPLNFKILQFTVKVALWMTFNMPRGILSTKWIWDHFVLLWQLFVVGWRMCSPNNLFIQL